MIVRAISAVAILLFAVSSTKDQATTLPDPLEDNSLLLMTRRHFHDDSGRRPATLQYADDVVSCLTHYNGRARIDPCHLQLHV